MPVNERSAQEGLQDSKIAGGEMHHSRRRRLHIVYSVEIERLEDRLPLLFAEIDSEIEQPQPANVNGNVQTKALGGTATKLIVGRPGTRSVD